MCVCVGDFFSTQSFGNFFFAKQNKNNNKREGIERQKSTLVKY